MAEEEEEPEDFKDSPVSEIPSLPPPSVKSEPEPREDTEDSQSEELDEDDSLDPYDDHTRRSVRRLNPFDLVRYAYEYHGDRRTTERILRYADPMALARARIFRPRFGLPEEWQSAAEDPPLDAVVKSSAPIWQIMFDLMHVNWNVWKYEVEAMSESLQIRACQFCSRIRHSSWLQYFLASEETRKMLQQRAGDEAMAFWREFMT